VKLRRYGSSICSRAIFQEPERECQHRRHCKRDELHNNNSAIPFATKAQSWEIALMCEPGGKHKPRNGTNEQSPWPEMPVRLLIIRSGPSLNTADPLLLGVHLPTAVWRPASFGFKYPEYFWTTTG